VPTVDSAVGAAVTFVAATLVGYLLALVLAPTPTATALAAAAGVVVGVAATVVLVFGGGYERLLVPVAGRRWAVELAVAFVAVAGAYAVEPLVPVLADAVVVLAVAAAILGSRYVGAGVAAARGWDVHADASREN